MALHRRLLPLTLIFSFFASPLSVKAKRPNPCRNSVRGKCYDHLAKGPMRDRLFRGGVGRFLSRRHMPKGPRVRGRPGDYYIRSTTWTAVIRARDGMLLDLALADDGRDRMGWGSVAICDSRGRHPVAVDGITLDKRSSPPALSVKGHVTLLGHRLDVVTRYSATGKSGAGLLISTRIKNPSHEARYNLRVCDHFGLSNTPLWVPGVGEVRPGQKPKSAIAHWAARSEHDVSWVLAAAKGQRMELDLGASTPYGAFDPAIAASYLPPFELAQSDQRVVRRILVLKRGTLNGALSAALRARGQTLQSVTISTVGEKTSGARIVVAHGAAHYFSTTLRKTIELAADQRKNVRVALSLPGVGLGPWKRLGDKAVAVSLEAPPRGWLALDIVDTKSKKPLPAKVSIQGQHKSKSPDFGRGEGLRVQNVIYAGPQQQKIPLAPGRYQLTVSRGPEYTVVRRKVRIVADKSASLSVALGRAFATPGWIAADLHTHCDASFDSPHRSATRVISAAATGIEFLVATDHNALTDHRSAITKAALGPRLLTAVGQEITTQGHQFGHFNAFPLAGTKPIAWYNQKPAAIFSAVRKRGRGVLIQVNHPRMGSIGYFDQLGKDPRSPRARSSLYRGDFDLLEVFNGDYLTNQKQVERNITEYFALLNHGKRYTATANSDAHRLPIQEVGTPRNMILWNVKAKDDDDAKRASPGQIFAALGAHRSQITTGPFIDLRIDGQSPGSTIKSTAKQLELILKVYARPDIDVRSVEIIESGKLLQHFTVRGKRTLRFQRRLKLRPKRSTWYVVRLRGERPQSLLTQKGVTPFAMSNPIWVTKKSEPKPVAK